MACLPVQITVIAVVFPEMLAFVAAVTAQIYLYQMSLSLPHEVLKIPDIRL